MAIWATSSETSLALVTMSFSASAVRRAGQPHHVPCLLLGAVFVVLAIDEAALGPAPLTELQQACLDGRLAEVNAELDRRRLLAGIGDLRPAAGAEKGGSKPGSTPRG